ncbi:hypothetical protein Tcan_08790 [Toxocara canis]|uniref:PDZ domain-containing protein n=1 Tax=Toxocara canis TaxID=6265 RepID=A0A0B2UTZ4_TOXCA|nr:hypothetical protein Tcan_08790 [Toxocara canis]
MEQLEAATNCIQEISLKLRYRQKVGLGITDFGGAVIVSRVDPGSLSSEVLQQGDELAEIDGKRPSSKDEASQMIVNALVRKRKVSMKVSRANGESQLNSSAKKLPTVNDAEERKKLDRQESSRWTILFGVPLFIGFIVTAVRWLLR